jgi:hypothetical protein
LRSAIYRRCRACGPQSDENGAKDTVDPEAFTIVNGKLTRYWTTEWRKNEAENISRADKNWVTVKDTPEPTM